MVVNNSFNIFKTFGRDYAIDYKSDEEMKAVELFQDHPKSMLNFGIVSCVLFVLIGIPGNLTTIIALAKCRKIRNSTAIFIINLHIGDFIFCCTVIPLTATTFAYNHWIYGIAMCRAYGFLKFLLIAVNMFTTVAIAVNRYVMVCHPLVYPNLYNRRNLSIMILMIWVAGFTMFFPSIFGVWGKYNLHPTGGFCTLLKDKHNRSPKMLLWLVTLIGSYSIMAICYARIWWVVRKTTKNSKKNERPLNVVASQTLSNSTCEENAQSSVTPLNTICSPASSPRETDKKLQRHFRAPLLTKMPTRRDKRLCTMIVAIMICFCISHVPIMTTKFLFKDDKTQTEVKTLEQLFGFLGWCINPIIYVLMSKEYRQAYKNLFDSIRKRS